MRTKLRAQRVFDKSFVLFEDILIIIPQNDFNDIL